MAIEVTLDNFARAETDRMFAGLVQQAGGVNRWFHNRQPTPIENQPVIRMNRDTLYSVAVVDIAGDALATLPDAGDRYLSVMVVNEDHYINDIFHEVGEHRVTMDAFDTPYVLLRPASWSIPRIRRTWQRSMRCRMASASRRHRARPFVMPDTTRIVRRDAHPDHGHGGGLVQRRGRLRAPRGRRSEAAPASGPRSAGAACPSTRPAT